jgi:hypothetical protein
MPGYMGSSVREGVALPHNRKAILLAIFVAFGGFLFGYDIGVRLS